MAFFYLTVLKSKQMNFGKFLPIFTNITTNKDQNCIMVSGKEIFEIYVKSDNR